MDNLFSLLSAEKSSNIELVWELLDKLPTNPKIKNQLYELKLVAEDKSQWDKLLDSKNIHRLLYCLKIVQEFSRHENI